MSKDKGPVALTDIPVTFGGVSIGEKTARIGISVHRDWLGLEQADKLFCERRLSGAVALGHADDAAGQAKLWDDADHQISTSFDIKGFRVLSESLGTGLTMNLSEIDISELAKFSKGVGRLAVYEVTDIPQEEKDRPDHVPGTLKADGPWAAVNLDTLFDPSKRIRKALSDAGLNTVGQLADYSASERRLGDIKGIGEAAAQEIEDRLLDFYADNPQASDAELAEV